MDFPSFYVALVVRGTNSLRTLASRSMSSCGVTNERLARKLALTPNRWCSNPAQWEPVRMQTPAWCNGTAMSLGCTPSTLKATSGTRFATRGEGPYSRSRGISFNLSHRYSTSRCSVAWRSQCDCNVRSCPTEMWKQNSQSDGWVLAWMCSKPTARTKSHAAANPTASAVGGVPGIMALQ